MGQGPLEPNEHSGAPVGGVYDWYQRGLALVQAGSPAAAVPLLERARDAEPESRSIQEALARALFDSRRYSEAAACFREIVEDNPTEDYSQYGLGLALSRLGKFTAAVEHLALAAAMRPHLSHYQQALRQARATIEAGRRTA